MASQNSVRFVVQTHKKDKAGNLQSDPCRASSSLQQIGGNPLREAPVFIFSPFEGEMQNSFETEREARGQNEEMRTRMNDVKEGLQGFGKVKVKRKDKTKPNQKIAQLLNGVQSVSG